MSKLIEDFNKLNIQQKQIINKFGKSSLIVAGPGTGKTRTISVLIGKLLENGLKLKEILALTFSSDAAEELKNRVLEYYPHSFDQCWISTFHSFCSRILTEQYYIVGIKPDFRLLTGFKEALLMDIICKKQQPESFSEFGRVLTKRGFQQEVLTFISLLKSNLVEPDDFEQVINNCKEFSIRTENRCKELLNLFRLYEQERISSGYLDFRDLISLTIKVLKDPDIADIYRDKFKAILVDEFQDTDPAQFLLLTLLNGNSNNIKTAVIGDPHQSIYRFRGADPSMMSDKSPFKKKYKAKVFPLKINYRSSKAVVETANKIKWSEKSATDSTLETDSAKKGFVKYYKAQDELEEARLISKKIASMLIYGTEEKIYKPEDIAILVRNNFQIDLITEQLNALHIPYDIAGNMKFYKSDEVMAISALLKILGKEGEEQADAIKRVFTSPVYGIPVKWTQNILINMPEVFSDIQNGINKEKEVFFTALPFNDDETKELVCKFIDKILELNEHKDEELETLFSRILAVFISQLADVDSPQGKNILIFRSLIGEFCELFEAANKRKAKLSDLMENFDEWLKYYAQTLETSSETSNNGIKIMTIHQSKGLEFPVVFVCGLSEGSFPVRLRENLLISTNSIETIKNEFDKLNREISFFNPYPLDFEDHLEEERRLFFVALTRAKDGLILTTPMKSGGDIALPAPFIKEIEILEIKDEDSYRPLSISDIRTELTKLSPDEMEQIEPVLKEAEENISEEISIHGLHPRKFNVGQHDKVTTLPHDFVFSASSIKAYVECPRKFFFQNLLRISRPNKRSQEYFDIGNAYHECFKALHQSDSPLEKGIKPDDGYLEQIIKDKAFEFLNKYNRLLQNTEFLKIKNALTNYITAVYDCGQFPYKNTIGVEKSYNFKFRGYNINARFDRISRDENGNVVVTDYKTSSTKTDDVMKKLIFPDEGYPLEIQIPLYLLACKENNMPNASMSLVFVKDTPYKIKSKAGHIKNATFKINKSSLNFGTDITDIFDNFEQNLEEILNLITQEKRFFANPSLNSEAKTCINKTKEKRCEFSAFCDYALEHNLGNDENENEGGESNE